MELEDEVIQTNGRSSLAFLQAVYHTAELPLHVRMKAAIAALPYEHPKLAVTAVLDGNGWASQLERCIARSRSVLELRVAQDAPAAPNGHSAQEVSASALRQPMTLIRRR